MDVHLRPPLNATLEIAECRTLRVKGLSPSGATLRVTPAFCQVESQRVCQVAGTVSKVGLYDGEPQSAASCVIVPCHRKHYDFLARLLHGILRYATDRMRIIVALSGDAVGSLIHFCAMYPSLCSVENATALRLEVTDLRRLVEADLSYFGKSYLTSSGIWAERQAADKRAHAARILGSMTDSAEWTRPLRKGGSTHGRGATTVNNIYLQALKKMLTTA